MRAAVIALLFLAGCTSSPVIPGGPTAIGNYPVSEGSYWFYRLQTVYYNFSNDTVKSQFDEDTVNATGISTWGGDTVINGITVKPLYSNHFIGVHSHDNIEYYIVSDSALMLFAALHGSYFSISDKRDASEDSLLIYDPPVIVLKQPLEAHDYWVMHYNGQDLFLRTVLEPANVNVPAGSFNTSPVMKRFLIPGGGIDSNKAFYDYVTSSGIMKKENYHNNIPAYDEFGMVVGYFDSKETIEVTNYLIR